jgi:hypothetical protein
VYRVHYLAFSFLKILSTAMNKIILFFFDQIKLKNHKKCSLVIHTCQNTISFGMWRREKMKGRVNVELVKYICTTTFAMHAYWPTLDHNKRIGFYMLIMLNCTVSHMTWQYNTFSFIYSFFFFPLVFIYCKLPFIAIMFIHLVYSFLGRRCNWIFLSFINSNLSILMEIPLLSMFNGGCFTY